MIEDHDTPYLSFDEALAAALRAELPAVEWLTPLLNCSEGDAIRLYQAADLVREQHHGSDIHLRGLIEFSNYCRKNCYYCGVRSANRKVSHYRLTPEEIITTAHHAVELGYQSIVLQSGEDLWFTRERLHDIILAIKTTTSLAITLSVGERSFDSYRSWREAGADRYLLRIETTNPALFSALHPNDSLEERKACLYNLRSLGYQLGSGVMVGLPGQTADILSNDVIWLYQLGAEMIGVGPFIPHNETPLANTPGGSVASTLRLVAVLRLVFPDAHLPATTAMGSLDPFGREQALQAGANVLMPNITPVNYRPKYEIYPGKICQTDDATHCKNCLTGRIHAIGRTISTTHGHVKRVTDATNKNIEVKPDAVIK